MADWNDQATWDAAYELTIRKPGDPLHGQTVSYGRLFSLYNARDPENNIDFGEQPVSEIRRARFLINRLEALGLNSTHRVIVVGAAFGYLVHGFHLRGYPNVWGVDFSTWIQNNFATETMGTVGMVWDNWLDNNLSRVTDKLDAVTGGHTFHVIITEDLVLDMTNPQLNQLRSACERALIGTDTRRIIHVVSTLPPSKWDLSDPLNPIEIPPLIDTNPPLNDVQWLTLQEWAAKEPSHTWVDRGNGDYILGVI